MPLPKSSGLRLSTSRSISPASCVATCPPPQSQIDFPGWDFQPAHHIYRVFIGNGQIRVLAGDVRLGARPGEHKLFEVLVRAGHARRQAHGVGVPTHHDGVERPGALYAHGVRNHSGYGIGEALNLRHHVVSLHRKRVEFAFWTGNVAIQAHGNVIHKFSHGTPISG